MAQLILDCDTGGKVSSRISIPGEIPHISIKFSGEPVQYQPAPTQWNGRMYKRLSMTDILLARYKAGAIPIKAMAGSIFTIRPKSTIFSQREIIITKISKTGFLPNRKRFADNSSTHSQK